MRVVCDNCGAVYKIANEKLSKEVNRATCKRCGHKIVIYKPGSRAAEEAAAADSAPQSHDEDEERTVIKSVPELQKMASSQQGVPSIGSLTAELRAISIPGIQSVGGPAPKSPDALGPAGPVDSDTVPPPAVLAPLPSQSAPPPGHRPSQPAVIQATAIPASSSPKTKVYDGPGPSMSAGAAASSAQPRGTDATRPMPLPTTGGTAPAPTNGSAGPVSMGSSTGLAGPSPLGSPSPAAAIGSATAVAPVSASTSPVLGSVTFFALLGLVGFIVAMFVPWPAVTLANGLVALALCACFCLATITDRGRRPERTMIAIVVAFFLAGLVTAGQFAAAGGIDLITGNTPEPVPEAFRPQPTPAPIKAPSTSPEGVDAVAGVGELDSDELEMARKYSTDEVAGLGGTGEDATPAKESKADVVTRPAPSERTTPAPARTPRRTSERTPEPSTPRSSGPSRPALREPDAAASSGTTDGPSPFVIDTIIRNNAAIVRCLRVEEAKGVDLSGKIYLKFTIAPEGTVSKARVTTSRFAGTALDSCISRELNSLKFPPFDGTPKKITYPLIVQ